MLDLESTEPWLATRNRDSRVLSCPRLLGLRLAGQHAVPDGQMPRASRCLVTCSPRAPSTLGLIGSQAAPTPQTAPARPAAIHDRPVLDQLWLSRPGSVRDPAILVAGQRRSMVSRNSWTSRTAIAPSPTADATRLTEPLSTSPTAKTPARPVSSMLL